MVNVMNEYVSYSQKCLCKYMKMICDKSYNKEITTSFVDAYIDVRYSNYIDEASEKLTLFKKIEKKMKTTAQELFNKLGQDKISAINMAYNFTKHFYVLDQLYYLEAHKGTIEKIAEERTRYFHFYDVDFENEFNNMLREDIKKKKEFLDNFNSPTFSLEYKNLSANELGVSLKHNIVFPEVYSEAAIKKAGERDTINEDMTVIAFLQLSAVIANDLINCDFLKTYYINLPYSLFDKKSKIGRIFNTVDNTFIQDRLRVVITYKCLTRYKSYIMEYMRNGFIFAIYLDDSFNFSTKNMELLELFDKVLIDSSKYYYKDIKNNGKIKNRIITVDEVK